MEFYIYTPIHTRTQCFHQICFLIEINFKNHAIKETDYSLSCKQVQKGSHNTLQNASESGLHTSQDKETMAHKHYRTNIAGHCNAYS